MNSGGEKKFKKTTGTLPQHLPGYRVYVARQRQLVLGFFSMAPKGGGHSGKRGGNLQLALQARAIEPPFHNFREQAGVIWLEFGDNREH